MVNLTFKDLENFNLEIQERYKTTATIYKRGLLKSLAETPERSYMGQYMYPDIFTKAASLFEGLCRLHVFSDLNKRTALVATRAYMRINGYVFLVPMSAVRLSVQVADDKNDDDEDHIQERIRKIAKWMMKYTARRGNLPEIKRAIKNAGREPRIIMLLYRLKLDPLAFYLLHRWLAFDIYPQYKLSRTQVSNFIFQMIQQARAEFEEDFPGHFRE